MEVDSTPPPAPASPAASLHAAAGPSMGVAFASRKRRRSSLDAGHTWHDHRHVVLATGSISGRESDPETIEENAWPIDHPPSSESTSVKRRNTRMHSDNWGDGSQAQEQEEQHHYATLGSAVHDGDSEATCLDQAGELLGPVQSAVQRATTDDGVDSPMHLLRLASHSPPGSLQTSPAPDDVPLRPFTASGMPTFMPRQVRTASASRQQQQRRASLSVSMQRDNSSAPFQPSPLATLASADAVRSSSPMSQQSEDVVTGPYDADQEVGNRSSLEIARLMPLRRTQSSHIDGAPLRLAQMQPSTTSAMSEDGGSVEGSNQSMTGSSAGSDDDGEIRGRTGWRNKPSFSPGLSSSPNFPGGKQMLRYTMGYRNDCELCRNKVPGHYGHVVHRD